MEMILLFVKMDTIIGKAREVKKKVREKKTVIVCQEALQVHYLE